MNSVSPLETVTVFCGQLSAQLEELALTFDQLRTSVENGIAALNTIGYVETGSAGIHGQVQGTARLSAGDVIRWHHGGAIDGATNASRWRITQLVKL